MKVQFEIVAFEVEKLYSKNISIDDTKAIDNQVLLIETFIKSCGYGVEEFFSKWFGDNCN